MASSTPSKVRAGYAAANLEAAQIIASNPRYAGALEIWAQMILERRPKPAPAKATLFDEAA